MHEDFEIFSNYVDLKKDQNEWSSCNYNDPDVGYPRDCGKSAPVGGKWFSFPGGKVNAPDLSNGAGFAIHLPFNCPSKMSLNFGSESVSLSSDGKTASKDVDRDEYINI